MKKSTFKTNEIGNTYNVKVLSLSDRKQGNHYFYSCLCKCGKVFDVRTDYVKKRLDCGCGRKDRATYEDLTGQTFTKLTVLSFSSNENGIVKWKCKCQCGRITIVQSGALKSKHSKSCGCLQKEAASKQGKIIGKLRKTHGLSDTSEYVAWRGMLARCFNKNSPNYKNYGGRGITVCADWLKFENFISDMGNKPTVEHSIDRYPNVNGNYQPDNCRWATNAEQQRNRRSNVKFTYKGKTQCLTEWAEEYGMSRKTCTQRFNKGWPIDKILETPVSPNNVKIGFKNKRFKVTH